MNQLFAGYGGSGGRAGCDGWLLSGAGCDGGQMALDSVEIDESMYPIIIEERKIACDSAGSGQWEGAPGIYGVIRPRDGDMTVYWGSDGDTNPPRGVLGGNDAIPSGNWIRQPDGAVEPLPAFGDVTIGPEQAVIFRSCGGGGYGPAAARSPEAIVHSVNRGWTSPERALTEYQTALVQQADGRWTLDADDRRQEN
jgi:N-methylhydantoinase B